MRKYVSRIVEKTLDKKLRTIGAVLIIGPKWSGKTTTGMKLSKSNIRLDDPDKMDEYLERAKYETKWIIDGETPRLIDEWQLVPRVWNTVRREVDDRGEMGQFILTGSAVPVIIDESLHTGTGRITKVAMRTMSLYESSDSNGSVSLEKLFNNEFESTICDTNLHDIVYLICRGGWPQLVSIKDKEDALELAINYTESMIEEDVTRIDGVAKDTKRIRRILRSYARNIGSQVSYEKILQDIKKNDVDELTRTTLSSYINALKAIFVIDDVNAWNPNLRSSTAIRTSDTRYLVDPSIATSVLEIGPNDLINDLRTTGFLFENLVIRDLKVYAESLGGSVYHYRDKTNLECDAVIHLKKGVYGLAEIKLGDPKSIDEASKNLIKLRSKLDTDKMKEPSFLMVIVGVSSGAYQRDDGVYVVPITCLKD